MRRIVPVLLFLAIAMPSEARKFVVNDWSNAEDPSPSDDVCDVIEASTATQECSFLAALQQPPESPRAIDTVILPRNRDSLVTLSFFQRAFDVAKAVVVIDSSHLATGRVRLRLDGLSLRFLASPVSITGLSFTRAGQNRSSIGLFGSGPDRLLGNSFNLTQGDTATDGLFSLYGVLVGAGNKGTRLESNRFGGFGAYASAGVVLRIYGDSTQVIGNSFGLSAAGAVVPFNGSAVVVSSYTATGQNGQSDTLFAPLGGRIENNRFAICSELSGGIGISGSKGEGGTRGWTVRGNRIGVDSLGNALTGCAVSTNETQAGVLLSANDDDLPLTSIRVSENIIGQVPNGILLTGAKVQGDSIVDNILGTTSAGAVLPIFYNGILLQGGARRNGISRNTVGHSSVGIRIGWSSGYGPADSNTVADNLVGVRPSGFTAVPNDTAMVLGYTSGGNIVRGNTLAGNRHHGLVLTSPYLLANRIERNRFGVTSTDLARPNGGAGFRSVAGGASQTLFANRFGPSGTWAVEVALSRSRATVLDSNVFLGGQDSGAILFNGADSLILTHSRFDSCKVACVMLRGSAKNRIVSNRFLGRSPAMAVAPHPTQSWLTSSATFSGNALPRVATPIDLLGSPGYTPNDPADTDAGPMGLLNHPVLSSVAKVGDTLALTLDLDLALSTTSPLIHLYAAAPGSEVLEFLGSWPILRGMGQTFRVAPGLPVAPGTLVRAGLTDAAGNVSELDSGKVVGTPTGVLARKQGARISPVASGQFLLTLDRASEVQWEIRAIDGSLKSRRREPLAAGTHALETGRTGGADFLIVEMDGFRQVVRLSPRF